MTLVFDIDYPRMTYGAFLAESDAEAARFVQTVLDTAPHTENDLAPFEGPRLVMDAFHPDCPRP